MWPEEDVQVGDNDLTPTVPHCLLSAAIPHPCWTKLRPKVIFCLQIWEVGL